MTSEGKGRRTKGEETAPAGDNAILQQWTSTCYTVFVYLVKGQTIHHPM